MPTANFSAEIASRLAVGIALNYCVNAIQRRYKTEINVPQISIVLPVFNGAPTIIRAARSILNQTIRDIELIVLDDGSTDDSAARVSKLRDPRLRLVRCPHRSVASASNAAVKLADAPIIARMDADDFAHPTRLEKQLDLLHSQDLDVVGCQVRILNDSGHAAQSLNRYEHWINQETIKGDQICALRFVEFPLVNPTILARRCYFDLGYRDDNVPEDYDLMLRAAARGLRFGKVEEVLFDWTDHPNRLTRTHSRYSLDAFMRCRRLHLLAGPLRDIAEVDLWGIGKAGKPWLRWLQHQEIAVRFGYDVNERKVNTRIHGVPIIHSDDLPVADGTPLLIAVGAKNARDVILPQVLSQGYTSGRDAWFIA